MKKQQFLACMFLLTSLSACTKKDDPSPADSSAILTSHVWVDNGTTALIDGKSYTGKNVQINGVTYKLGADSKTTVTFKQDGTYQSTGDDADTGKWKLTGNVLDLTDSSGDTKSGTLTNVSDSGFTLSLPEVDPTANTDISNAELLAAVFVLGSNGIDINKLAVPKKIQIQENFVAK